MVSEIGRTYIAGFLSPTSLLGFFFIIGLIFLLKNKIKFAKIVFTVGTLAFVLMSMAPLKMALYSVLETEQTKIPDDFKYVVVLGGKIYPNDNHPLSSQITPSLLSRLTYAIELVKAHPGTTLVLTGNGAEKKSEADLMGDFALAMGVSREQIILEKLAMNTEQHPLYLKSLLQNQKFVIVTSAYHMKRAMGLFKRQGLEGYPAPTDYQNKHNFSLSSLIMRGENFAALDRVITEFYSSLWNNIKTSF